jgi:DNA-binding transcriptional MerR regulator
MGRPKLIYSLKDIERKTGISYPTLILYAKEFADQIPTLGSGRTRRYPAEAVAVFQQIFSKRRPGRKRGAAWRGLNASPAEGEGAASAPPLQLAEEDRELMRNLTEALREVAAKLQAFTESGRSSSE